MKDRIGRRGEKEETEVEEGEDGVMMEADECAAPCRCVLRVCSLQNSPVTC